jgi:glycosyltransferase involved in cell wall biosynthesis
VAEKWPGAVVYYVTDFFPAYGNKPAYIATLDKLMCAAAALVCPNSRRIAEYLQDVAGCPAEKILIVPNATRSSNVLPEPLVRPAALPDDIADLPRPIAGVIGNLAANTDWKLVCEVIRQTPWLSWVFVGPATTPIRENDQREARQSLLNLGGRVRFTGEKPYGQLSSYARACNVGVLPYRSIEPTFSGSSTRFYEHLAACQPMIATRGFAELLEKEPLLRLVDDAREMAATLEELSALSFHDGYEEMRWQASRQATWEQRATTMIATLSHRFEKGRVVAA